MICSPTGTGKTLAAFLPVFSRLAQLRDDDELFPRTYALYISPLRALGYEVPPPRRPERSDPGLWDGVTSEGRSGAEASA